ncbi:MAG TPA: hypothetical protein VGP68_07170 [Gemmataceae bacterium]|nr:hypothetical protein [Gemmataceae bacterium]
MILAAWCCLAADEPEQPPVRGRPDAFSGIVGAVELQASATPTEVQVENPLIYKLRLKGPPTLATLAVPDLRKVRGFDARFAIRLLAERWLPQVKTREFEFELRPKNVTVDAIPPFSFVYYLPGSSPPERGYQTRFTQSIPIKVIERAKTSVQALEIVGIPEAPSEADLPFDFSADLLVEPSAPWHPAWAMVALVALVPPVLVCIRARKWWNLRRGAETACSQTRELARALSTMDPEAPDANDKVRLLLGHKRHVMAAIDQRLGHSEPCHCQELLGACRAYLYGGTPRELLNQLVARARSIASSQQGGER